MKNNVTQVYLIFVEQWLALKDSKHGSFNWHTFWQKWYDSDLFDYSFCKNTENQYTKKWFYNKEV